MLNEIPISTIKLPEGRFQTFSDHVLIYACPRSLDESRAALRMQHS